MFYAFWAWYMGHTSEYADFTFFDSFCFNRIHCNFHYWAWLSLVYGSYEQVASLYTVITFFDRLIWLCYTSSQKIYVCFWCFLTAFGYYRKWLFFKGIHCNFMIVLGIWVDHWTFIFHLQCNVWYGMAWYYIGTYWWRFLYLHYLLQWRRCSILKYIFHDLCADCISQPIYFMLHCRLWIFYMISFGGFLAECLPCFFCSFSRKETRKMETEKAPNN